MKAKLLLIAVVLLLAAGAGAQTLPACPAAKADMKLPQNCMGPLAVTADDITIDLGGKTITCTSANPWIGIDISGRQGVLVQNGFVVNCVRGVSIVAGGGHTVKKLTLKQSAAPAASPVRYGVYVEASTANWFEALTAQNNTVGVDITTSFDNGMKGLKLLNNVLDGLQLDLDATDNEIADSTISGNGRFGVYFGSRAARNSVYHNQILNNGWAGLIPDSANIIEDNTIKGNGHAPDSGAWLRGGVVPFGSNNIIAGNDASGNAGYGIVTGLIPESQGIANTILWNKAGSNALWDLADLIPGLCTDNDWRENEGVKLADGCENEGGLAPDYKVAAAGKAGVLAFEINARRIKGGASSGQVKLVNVLDASGNRTKVKVEGRVSCLVVDPARPRVATVGIIVDKSSDAAVVPLYSTLHVFVADRMPATGGVTADQVAVGMPNQFAPGYCPILTDGTSQSTTRIAYLSAPSLPPITKGEVIVIVK